MNCTECEKLLIEFVNDDDLREETANAVKEHILKCSDCWDKFSELLDIRSNLLELMYPGVYGMGIFLPQQREGQVLAFEKKEEIKEKIKEYPPEIREWIEGESA